MAYDATKAFIQALRNIQQREDTPTRRAIANELHSDQFKTNGASGEIQFEQSGDRQQESQLVGVGWSGFNSLSGTGYDFK